MDKEDAMMAAADAAFEKSAKDLATHKDWYNATLDIVHEYARMTIEQKMDDVFSMGGVFSRLCESLCKVPGFSVELAETQAAAKCHANLHNEVSNYKMTICALVDRLGGEASVTSRDVNLLGSSGKALMMRQDHDATLHYKIVADDRGTTSSQVH